MEVHGSARRHGITEDDIAHAVDHPGVVVDLDPEADPPKLLVIGPDRAGNLLEVIILILAGNRTLAIHAMRLRRQYRGLLPRGESEHD